MKVMTDQFCVWSVNYTNRSLETFIAQRRRNINIFSQVEKEIWNINFMKERFVTFGMRRSHIFALGRCVPVRGRRNCAVVGSKSDGHRFLSKMFAYELAEIEFSSLAHLRRARVAEVRIVRPNDDLCRRPLVA